MVVVIIEVVVIKSSSIVSYFEIKPDPNNSWGFLRGVVLSLDIASERVGFHMFRVVGGRDG